MNNTKSTDGETGQTCVYCHKVVERQDYLEPGTIDEYVHTWCYSAWVKAFASALKAQVWCSSNYAAIVDQATRRQQARRARSVKTEVKKCI